MLVQLFFAGFFIRERNKPVRVKLGMQNIFLELNNKNESGYYT
jgi:hypothetical protein